MSLQEAERVMQRALRDEAFRALLQTNPAAALASYELTPEERARVLGTDAAAVPPRQATEEPST